MNTNTKRMVLAAIAAFYVVVGGLWASNYFPYQKFEAQMGIQRELIEKMGFDAAIESVEYRKSRDIQMDYSYSSPSVEVTFSRISLYETLLMWGTVALAVGGGVLFLTRGRKAGAQ